MQVIGLGSRSGTKTRQQGFFESFVPSVAGCWPVVTWFHPAGAVCVLFWMLTCRESRWPGSRHPHPTKRSTIDSVELVSVSTFWRGTFPVFRRSVTWRPGGLGMLRYCPVELQTSRPPDSTRGVDDRLWQLKLFSERSNVQVHPYVRTGLSFGELPHNSSRYMFNGRPFSTKAWSVVLE